MNPAVPHRHPNSPRKVPGLRPLAVLLGIRPPSHERWHLLGEALWIGDPLMDELVEWMYRLGIAEARVLFERALSDGIAGVPEAPAELRAFFAEVERLPPWLDYDKIACAEQAFRRGGSDGLYIARDVSFLGGYLASGFNQTLLRTGALEKGPGKRFAETLQWALDVTAEGGMLPQGIGYRSTVRVRLIHAMVRRHLASMPDWRAAEWGLPINQTDMAATLIGALIAPVVGAVALGVVVTPRELEAAAHLARYVGRLIGVEERFLPTDFRDAVRILYHSLSAITSPDETSRRLALPMADDPLHWHFDRFPGIRGRFARAQHLSIASTFLGPSAMRRLGLPARCRPWYPLMRFPVNIVRGITARLTPGGLDRAARRGRRKQVAFLRTLVPNEPVVVGGSIRQVGEAV
ncbi:oxygenase MpaB family protein [Nocardia nova]